MTISSNRLIGSMLYVVTKDGSTYIYDLNNNGELIGSSVISGAVNNSNSTAFVNNDGDIDYARLNRLKKVRSDLTEGVNPYSDISSKALGSGSYIDNVEKSKPVKVLTSKQRLDKFNSRVGTKLGQWTENDGPVDPNYVPVQVGLKCIGHCGNNIQATNSVYGIVYVQHVTSLTTEVVQQDPLVERKKLISYDVPLKGWICRSCFDALWATTWLDDKLVRRRGVVVADPPKHTTTEVVTHHGRAHTHSVPVENTDTKSSYAQRDMRLAQGRPERVEVTLPFATDKWGNVTDEWKGVKLPKTKPEPVDPNGYAYVFRGRLGRNRRAIQE